MGSLTANEERFMKWRTIDGKVLANHAEPQLEVMLKGMLEPRRLLDIVQNFILFQTDGVDTFKILATYHQYHAVNKAVKKRESRQHMMATIKSVLFGIRKVQVKVYRWCSTLGNLLKQWTTQHLLF